jgi:lipoprotein-anchoring transpeptidase ErfK/SrfK
MTSVLFIILVTLAQTPAAPQTGAQPPSQGNAAPREGSSNPSDVNGLAMQVMLDRAGFSPGVLDGKPGSNTEKALRAYQSQNGDEATPSAAPTIEYTITAADVAGPFVEEIPSDLVAQATLPALSYKSPLEQLAERFHSTPELLQRLNPDVRFAEGDVIRVPNVRPMAMPAEKTVSSPIDTSGSRAASPTSAPGAAPDAAATPDVTVTVSRSASAVTVAGSDGRIVFYAPVTTGSEHDPLPIGEWTVRGVQFDPSFHYNPALFWDADAKDTKATIPPGPNNPVGLVWIDISKDHYGLHGTPEPSQIGRTESHGCVRLTNWDALTLAGLVKPGTRVVFTE